VNIDEELANIQANMENESLSKKLITSLLIILAGIFTLPVFKSLKKDKTHYFSETHTYRFSELLLTSAAVSSILWTLFYVFSHYIWGLNPHVSAYEFTPIIRVFIYEHDGAESFALYLMMFLNIVLTLFIAPQLLKTRRFKSSYLIAFILLLILSAYYFYNIGFFPPVVPINNTRAIELMVVAGLLSIGIYFLYLKKPWISILIVTAFAAFASLISFSMSSISDLQYILAPSLRLLHAAKVSDIYFQYDIFLSLLGELWMKCHFSLDSFPYLGNISFFLFFIGSFFFATRFFKTKGLVIPFIIALIIARIYIEGSDSPSVFQVMPLRLDLWIVLLLIASQFGIRHWLMGIFLGLLVLFHRNLGLIYLVAYVELMATLFLLDIIPLVQEKNVHAKSLTALVGRHFRLNLINLAIVLASVALCFVLFHEFFSASALNFRKLGIGMLRISRISFYWYVPVLLSSTTALLFLYRRRLGSRYESIGLFIILLAIGNSMYFFGRSHENNILNISGILVFLLFLLFDLLCFLYQEPENVTNKVAAKEKSIKTRLLTKSRLYQAMPFVFILFMVYFYSDRIYGKLLFQYDNLQESNLYYPLPEVKFDAPAVKQATNNSQKVYFLDYWTDFYFYYYGNYEPQGYFNPCASWIYKKDLVAFMQGLLDKGYYIVYTKHNANDYAEYVNSLKYNQTNEKNDFVAISR